MVLEEHAEATKLYLAAKLSEALGHSRHAIAAYEATRDVPHGMSTGDLPPDAVGKIYVLGALIAQRLHDGGLAHEYAKGAVHAADSPYNQSILAVALANLGRFDEADSAIAKALTAEPDNPEFLRLKAAITARRVATAKGTH